MNPLHSMKLVGQLGALTAARADRLKSRWKPFFESAGVAAAAAMATRRAPTTGDVERILGLVVSSGLAAIMLPASLGSKESLRQAGTEVGAAAVQDVLGDPLQ